MRIEQLPSEILTSVSWSFTGPLFLEKSRFVSEVNEWSVQCGDTSWEPDRVVLPVPRVLVTYPSASDTGEETIELVSENGEYFTADDLLFKIHNAIVGDVGNLDHHFFEGLHLNSLPVAGNPPLYQLWLGS